jgi:benzoylformate decarboxylase
MPAAVGVALAKPGERVIGLIGDGSAMYAIQALWSAAQLALPMTFLILKNRRYAALQEFAPLFGYGADEPVAGTELPDLDFVALAAGQGVQAVRVAHAAQLRPALEQALGSSAPLLVEIEVA